jgi:LPXTG-motif cell wall-anchored protein
LNPNPAALGTTVTVSGSGCPANTQIVLTLNGVVQVSNVLSASNGTFSFLWTPATTLQSGTFPLTLTCGTSTVTHDYTISAGTITPGTTGSLPVTGDRPTGLIIAGVTFIILGAGATMVARRSRDKAEAVGPTGPSEPTAL